MISVLSNEIDTDSGSKRTLRSRGPEAGYREGQKKIEHFLASKRFTYFIYKYLGMLNKNTK